MAQQDASSITEVASVRGEPHVVQLHEWDSRHITVAGPFTDWASAKSFINTVVIASSKWQIGFALPLTAPEDVAAFKFSAEVTSS